MFRVVKTAAFVLESLTNGYKYQESLFTGNYSHLTQPDQYGCRGCTSSSRVHVDPSLKQASSDELWTENVGQKQQRERLFVFVVQRLCRGELVASCQADFPLLPTD